MTSVSTEQEDNQDPHAEELTDELARKYDPDRLLKIVSRRAGRGEALDHAMRSRYEKRFGVDLGHVRVYTGEFAEEFNRQRNAYAVTIGSTGMILMGNSPEKSIGSASGQALLAHELTHVAQQSGGQPRVQAQGDLTEADVAAIAQWLEATSTEPSASTPLGAAGGPPADEPADSDGESGIAGERGIPSVNRVRSVQSRVTSLLAVMVMGGLA